MSNIEKSATRSSNMRVTLKCLQAGENPEDRYQNQFDNHSRQLELT